MCGFAFSYEPNSPMVQRVVQMEAALEALYPRGPDEGAVQAVGGALLGHRRLSIIDLASSHQPFTDSTSRYSIVFNGEIYNYQELKGEIGNRWQFRTSGDTEVLLAGLVLYGESFLNRLRGMWAFVLWDDHEKRLVASRDVFGKKPLYFRYGNEASNGSLFFASEIPALLKLSSDGSRPDINSDGLGDYFGYGYVRPGSTFFQGVIEVKPGHLITWGPGRKVEEKSFLPFIDYRDHRKPTKEEVYYTFKRAVDRRLISDVPVGSFLSGGVDSSLVSAFANKKVPIKTFALGFDGNSFDESSDAMKVANYIGSYHHSFQSSEADYGSVVDRMLDRTGQPFADPSFVPTFEICSHASSFVKVCLSGDGADELFGGYQRYIGTRLSELYRRVPQRIRSGLESVISRIPEPHAHHSGSILKKVKLFLAYQDYYDRNYVAPLITNAGVSASLASYSNGRSWNIPEWVRDDSLVLEIMKKDVNGYLPQDILRKVDAASMACSLEVRSPFLDIDLAMLAMRMEPKDMFGFGLEGKKVLKEVFYNEIPSFVWSKPKHGFASPVATALNEGKLKKELIELTDSVNQDYLNKKVVQTLLKEHATGHDHSHILWAIYVFLRWYDGYFRVGN